MYDSFGLCGWRTDQRLNSFHICNWGGCGWVELNFLRQKMIENLSWSGPLKNVLKFEMVMDSFHDLLHDLQLSSFCFILFHPISRCRKTGFSGLKRPPWRGHFNLDSTTELPSSCCSDAAVRSGRRYGTACQRPKRMKGSSSSGRNGPPKMVTQALASKNKGPCFCWMDEYLDPIEPAAVTPVYCRGPSTLRAHPGASLGVMGLYAHECLQNSHQKGFRSPVTNRCFVGFVLCSTLHYLESEGATCSQSFHHTQLKPQAIAWKEALLVGRQMLSLTVTVHWMWQLRG